MRPGLPLLIGVLAAGCTPTAPITITPSALTSGPAGNSVELCVPRGQSERACYLAALESMSSVLSWDLDPLRSGLSGRCETIPVAIGAPGHYDLPMPACESNDAFTLSLDVVAADGTFAATGRWSLPTFPFEAAGRLIDVPLLGFSDPTARAFIEVDDSWREVNLSSQTRTVRWPNDVTASLARFRAEVDNPPRFIEFEMAVPPLSRGYVQSHRGRPGDVYHQPVDDSMFTWTGTGFTLAEGVLSYEAAAPSALDVPRVTGVWEGSTPWGPVAAEATYNLGMPESRPGAGPEPSLLVTGDTPCRGATQELQVQILGREWTAAPSVTSEVVEILEVRLAALDVLVVSLSVPDEPALPYDRLLVDGVEVPLWLGHWRDRNLGFPGNGAELLSERTEESGFQFDPRVAVPPSGGWWTQPGDGSLSYGLLPPTGVPRPALLQQDCHVQVEDWIWEASSFDGAVATLFLATLDSEPLPIGIPSYAILDAPEGVVGLDLERAADDILLWTPVLDPGTEVEQGSVLVTMEGTVGQLDLPLARSAGWPEDCLLPWVAEGEQGSWELAGLPLDAVPDPTLDPRVTGIAWDGWIATLQLEGPVGGGAPALMLSSPSDGPVGIRSCRPDDDPSVGVFPPSIPPDVWSEVWVRFPDAQEPPADPFIGIDGDHEFEVLGWPDPREVQLRVRPHDRSRGVRLRFADAGRWWGVELDTMSWWTWPAAD